MAQPVGGIFSRLDIKMFAGLRPIYGRRLGWPRGPSGELSCDFGGPLVGILLGLWDASWGFVVACMAVTISGASGVVLAARFGALF